METQRKGKSEREGASCLASGTEKRVALWELERGEGRREGGRKGRIKRKAK